MCPIKIDKVMHILSFRHRRVVLDFASQVQGLALPDLCSSNTHSGHYSNNSLSKLLLCISLLHFFIPIK